jgi:tetratricopeptide (TPR) repeat protein
MDKVNPNRIRRFKGKQSKLYKRILIEIEQAIQTYPDYADLYNQFGLFLAVEGDLEEAEFRFLEALSLNPKYREATLNLGFLYIDMRRWKEAENIILPEIKKYPKDGFLRHALGIIYLKTGRKKDALIQIRKAIQCQPYYRDYYKKRGILRGGGVRLDLRRAEALKKSHLNHLCAQFHNFIGLYLAKKGKSAQAVRELKKAAKLKPNEFLFHSNLGTVYYYDGAYLNAIKEYQLALKMDPLYGMGYANLSYTYGSLNRTQEALQYMEKAVRLSPHYADLHYNLALLYSDRRRYKNAISELRKALRINPDYLFARINLGVLFEDQKKWSEARREYRKILEITPDNEDVRMRLERIS